MASLALLLLSCAGDAAVCDSGEERVLYETLDWYSDGVDQRSDYVYDAEGNRARSSFDADLDNQPDAAAAWTWDRAGHLLTEVTDEDADGVAESVLTNTWRDDLLQLQYVADSGGDLVDRYTYEGDRLVSRQEDLVNDGTIDNAWTYTYNAEGELEAEEVDWGNDGAVDERTDWTYGSNGDAERSVTTYASSDVVVDREWEDGLLVTETTDYSGWQETEVYTYQFDGDPLTQTHSSTADDGAHWRYEWEYLDGQVQTKTWYGDSGTDVVTYSWGCPELGVPG